MRQLKRREMTIQIEIKRVYGNVVAYPLCAQAKLFASIAGTSTLTSQNLKRIQALGYSFECKTYDIQEVMA
jgi:hypothetical protein